MMNSQENDDKENKPIRNGRHQRNRASTTHSWTTNKDSKPKKSNDGPRKIAASLFKSPELEGRSTFGNQRKRASIGAILAPAFEQQKTKQNIQDQDDDDHDHDMYFTTGSFSSKSENSKKALIPKRDLTSVFEKKRAGNELHATPEPLPKIIITPPVPQRQGKVDIAYNSRAGNYLRSIASEDTEKETATEDRVTASGVPVPDSVPVSDSMPDPVPDQETPKITTATVDDELASLPFEHELPSFEVQEKRTNDDNKGIEGIKLVIDAFLSDFFVERPYDHAKRLFPSLSDLLISSMEPANQFELSKWGRFQPIPSLRAHCAAIEGEEMVVLHPRWVRWKLQSTLDVVLDHIITGIVALVVDDRAPYGTPPVMAALIDSLTQNLITPEEIHLNRSPSGTEMIRSGQDNALGAWVQMCAMAVGLGVKAKEVLTVADVIHTSTNDEKDAWKSCLKDIDPAKRLVVLLTRHIHVVLERGKAARERNNLLVVPPVQRGSRKRWLAANAEHRARRASHDENFAKLTSGQISEGEYRSTERRLAAEGHPRDIFATLHLVRFVGELYKVSVLTKYDLRDWLDRFLFDTVFPGVPSMYELEAGCALLLTVGRTIEEQSGKKYTSSSSPEQAQSPSFLRMDVGSSPVKPTFDLMKMECETDDELSWSIVEKCIGRLQEIQQIEEVNEEGKIWCREMVAMHQRGWRRAGPSESHMNAVSSAAQAARRARRGPHRNRQQNKGRSGKSTTTPTSLPTRQSPVQKGEGSNNQTDSTQSSSEESKIIVTVQDYEFQDE
ncbi:uncharacterized protein FA14DRAFT_183625 [Meira miltonrushii]|uniref:Uncharacterized protein n=1 Tax=Meira miltonrushii TaxID=1280837 RepID=A0A316VJH6_9BASI|nr:uncharacterized protein FA14DRAFT_183625 [Meira miltonrushii]PWN37772.1 hypothetical protein FA14DRAFT_183625 [Meira miltonrushii]